MDFSGFFMIAGFLLAAYSVIANDSVQTLGTFIASNSKVRWQYLWLFTSVILIATLSMSFFYNGGDISSGRLAEIPFQKIEWYHAAAPLALVILTRFGIPVSTSLLVLSAFATGFVFEKILLKSVIGYALAAVVAFFLWFLAAIIFRKFPSSKKSFFHFSEKTWRVFQWAATGFLWSSWLAHDMANIAVFLPRSLSGAQFLAVLAVFVAGLAIIFRTRGGKIQKIILEKTDINYVRAATFIDLTYAFLLLYFKNYNDIPMSTTWVFVGLLAGRELAISLTSKNYHFRNVFPIVGRDLSKMVLGLTISVAVVIFVQYI